MTQSLKDYQTIKKEKKNWLLIMVTQFLEDCQTIEKKGIGLLFLIFFKDIVM
jgi:hypothetical protein